MSLPEDSIIPSDPPAPEPVAPIPSAARARRRRAARAAMFPTDAEGQAALVASLSRRAYPSLELFVFSLVCGAIVGLGFMLDSQAVLLLGILVTPIMTPWVGLLLAVYTGKTRFLLETLAALLISGVIVFLGGLLTGFAARLFLPMTLDNVFIHARLWYPELIVLSLGSVTLVASFARSEDKPFLPSILIAYAFYLPINASGFGLGSGVEGIWPQGLYVFIVHFSLASLLGLITLFVLRLEPTKAGGLASGITMIALAVILVFLMFPQVVSGVFSTPPVETSTPAPTLFVPPSETATALPTATAIFTNTPRPTNTLTFTPSVTPNSAVTLRATFSITLTSIPSTVKDATATVTITPGNTNTPTATQSILPSATPSATPTTPPVLGKINAGESGGANLRQTPNGKYIMTLLNGAVVEVSPEKRTVNGVEWLRVFATVDGQRLEGWLLASVVEYDNPSQGTVTPSP